MKSGTTSLHSYMSQHPDIYMPGGKGQETHYFDNPVNYKKGLSWYSEKFSAASDQQVIGQTRPIYMFLDYVPKRIYEVMPDAKLLFILRNPIDRAYSHYWHEWKKNREPHSFKKALELEEGRLQGDDYTALKDYSYLSRGFYFEQISRYLGLFPSSQIKVVIFEEFLKDPKSHTRDCYKFLGVDDDFSPEFFGKENSTILPKRRWLKKILINRFTINSKILKSVNSRYNTTTTYPTLDIDTRRMLEKTYEEDIGKLERFIGHELSIWRKGS